MSPDLERHLRESRGLVPTPDDVITARARGRALRAFRRRRVRRRVLVLAAAALIIALGLGVSASTFAPPSVTASGGPRGLGFLPEPGWYVLQSGGGGASTSRPAVAVASNVPFAREDDIRGLAESSALPYETLLSLPARGVVIVAVFTPRGVDPWFDERFQPTRLPLRLLNARVRRDVTNFPVRHEQPLGQYTIGAAANGHNIAVTLYFGREHPDGSQLDAAQRQLAGLVVRASSVTLPARPATAGGVVTHGAPSVFDRTVVCVTQPSGGIQEIEARAHDGVRELGGSRWLKLPYAVVSTGGVRSFDNVLDDTLVRISAGKPVSTTTIDYAWNGVHPHIAGTLAVSTRNCRIRSPRIPLTRAAGLRGGSPGQLGQQLDCTTGRRVVVRVRAVFASPPKLRSSGGFLVTTDPITQATFVARTESGKALVHAETARSGRTQLFTAKGCKEE